ncbi:MAG: phage tail protein [Pseudomonadota bacterium]
MPVLFVPPKPPSVRNAGVTKEVEVRRVNFEGRYSQRSRTGPNALAASVRLSFANLTEAQRDVLDAFFEARGGTEAFRYQPPGLGTEKLWSCSEWGFAPERNKVNWSFTATLIQEFDIV